MTRHPHRELVVLRERGRTTLTGGDRLSGAPEVEMEEDLSEGPADRGQDGEDPHQEEEARTEMVTEVRTEMATVDRTTTGRRMTPGEPHRTTLGDQGEMEVEVGAAEVPMAMGREMLSSFLIPTGTQTVMSMQRCSHRWSMVNSR